jgi:S-methylmethionine-dependent homocysteine/selenocysteine methylase
MKTLLQEHNLILMEAAIVERLRRTGVVELHPGLVHAALVYDVRGRAELEKLYQGYLSIAAAAGLPILLTTPTWRANAERVTRSGVDPKINADCTRFMLELRASQGREKAMVKIGGFMGCKNDTYLPAEGLSAAESERFHAWQVDQLAQAGVDFLMAGTLPNVQEAVGIAKAMEKTGTPYLIGFVIDRSGSVLDGTSLWNAVSQIDAATQQRPLGYMVTCSYPSFLCADRQPEALFTRLLGYQANSSSLSHSELDEATRLQQDKVAGWAKEMLNLNRGYGVKILGGCCGTDDKHLSALAGATTA